MQFIANEKRFYFLSIALLALIFIITLVQNIIRYSHHSSYSIWTSIIYLCVSVLLFIPVIVLGLQVQKKIKNNYKKWYWTLNIGFALLVLLLFYVLSNVILHSLGYFENYIDSDYARYYYGREALYHLFFVLTSAAYVYFQKSQKQTIEVYKGRKLVTIPLEMIHWIEAEGHYLNFYTQTEKYLQRNRIGALAKQLHPDFVRIHRKYIVNKNQIFAMEKEKREEYIVLKSKERLKIGQSFKPIEW
nr:LytTR family DNA-binding domain-containing protein [uncultured Allomuricauda sp.]